MKSIKSDVKSQRCDINIKNSYITYRGIMLLVMLAIAWRFLQVGKLEGFRLKNSGLWGKEVLEIRDPRP